MRITRLLGAIALATLLGGGGAPALGQAIKYPDWESQWRDPNTGPKHDPWDPTRPMGLGQQAPLTPEYQTVLKQSLADQAAGRHGNDHSAECMLPGMPRMMSLAAPMEIFIRPKTTTMLFLAARPRHIYTDGRDWPDEEATLQGYSIGRWIDTDGDGAYDLLEIETRNFTGPRALESTGLPLADNNETIVKERIYIDESDHDLLHDEITTIDGAFTRPWTVLKSYVRERNPKSAEQLCQVDRSHVFIGGEEYLIDADGKLAPLRPGQPPPDLDYFQ